MKRNFSRSLFIALIALGLAVPVGVTSVAPSLAAGKSATPEKTQRGKKPAQACEQLDHNSKAYNDCVKAQAQQTKGGKSTAGKHGKVKKGSGD